MLARAGHSVTVIDRHATRLPWSRAIAIGPDTLDLFAGTGVDSTLVAAARPVRHIMIHDGAAPLASIAGPGGAGGRPIHILGQAETEDIIERAALAAGARLRRPLAFVGLDDATDQGCHVTLRAPDGAEERARFDWVIGADGLRSAVRDALGIPFALETRPETWHAADIESDWPFDAEIVLMPMARGFCGAFRMPGDLVRMVSLGEAPLLALPGVTPRRLVWQSDFRIHFAQAPAYGRGRVWLAGDAAHVHSPAGGRGMNMGIGDAMALAAAIGTGDLGRYEAERHRVAADFIRLNHKLSSVIGMPGWRGRSLRALIRLLAPLAVRYAGALMERLSRGAR